MSSLDKFAHNINSQNGEDGIIAELVRRLELGPHGYCMEFGAGDGVMLSNTLELTKQGWATVLCEQNTQSAESCRHLSERVGVDASHIVVFEGTVGFEEHDGVDAILTKVAPHFPEKFDVLSIDIDSYDYQVWRAMKKYQPKIVIIEINSSIPLGVEQFHGQHAAAQGSSFTSTVQLGFDKGYHPVCHTGNIIFVASEYLTKAGLPARELSDPNCLFKQM